MSCRVERIIEGKPFSIEAGRVARQADGAVLVQYGDTVVLVTAVASKQMRQGVDFFPLTVDYQERAYAAGKIPGGFFKREGRPHEKETLTSRLIDRPLRPLFPDGYRHDVQIIATVLSADQENDPDVLAVLGASAALTIAPIPFLGPIGAVRVGRVGGKLVLNPTYAQMEGSDIDMVVAGTRSAVVMLEAGANEVPEALMMEAIEFGHKGIQPMIDMALELAKELRVEKAPFSVPPVDPELGERVNRLARQELRTLTGIAEKEEQRSRRQALLDEVIAAFSNEPEDRTAVVRSLFEQIEHEELRRMILEDGRRADGRSLEEVRPITAEVSVLPRTHGSALFTRGQTQALVTTTLGTSEDEQRLDNLEGEGTKRFMLHYNFPPFSVGEVKFMRGPGRREIGHGALAERALLAALPTKEEFAYTLRIVSDILESNGSSSMATVCGASLSLMDAGVPIRSAVAGVAMGLVMENEQAAILTDIIGLEDHLGDMDFKVAGTRKGITALQLDIKTQGITPSLMPKALDQARRARLHILDQMDRAIAEPRSNMSAYAPRIITLMIPVDKIRDVIGPGGKVIRGIVADSGAKIDVSDDGRVEIASVDEEAAQKALSIISKIVEVPEVGKVYQGKVVKIMDFGAFVQILPGTDGLLHISQIAEHRVKRVEDVLAEGDEVMVKVIDVDKNGKIRLSRKEVVQSETQVKAE
ncbi:MAG: polyribonucleotide nucleotidyltransferase [candidate division NC10 bacterium]|nr:polyribonucleotide nucleotidyltransferase [candidate division NC10 bacterium]MDE2484025.1 polyribonucleotide nucleotidyltransferase [candidate division NC10 bacterium]